MSPATLLNHEIDHANEDQNNPKETDKLADTPDVNYGDKEEKRLIEGSEQTTARKHGDIEKGEVTRNDHEGKTVKLDDSTSNTPSN